MRPLLKNEYFELLVDEPQRTVRFRRSATPYPSIEVATHTFEAAIVAVRAIDPGSFVLLTDLREGPSRNDRDFERAILDVSTRLFAPFRARATIVRTAAGKLQIQRLSRERGDDRSEVFSTEADALRYLESILRNQPSRARPGSR